MSEQVESLEREALRMQEFLSVAVRFLPQAGVDSSQAVRNDLVVRIVELAKQSAAHSYDADQVSHFGKKMLKQREAFFKENGYPMGCIYSDATWVLCDAMRDYKTPYLNPNELCDKVEAELIAKYGTGISSPTINSVEGDFGFRAPVVSYGEGIRKEITPGAISRVKYRLGLTSLQAIIAACTTYALETCLELNTVQLLKDLSKVRLNSRHTEGDLILRGEELAASGPKLFENRKAWYARPEVEVVKLAIAVELLAANKRLIFGSPNPSL